MNALRRRFDDEDEDDLFSTPEFKPSAKVVRIQPKATATAATQSTKSTVERGENSLQIPLCVTFVLDVIQPVEFDEKLSKPPLLDERRSKKASLFAQRMRLPAKDDSGSGTSATAATTPLPIVENVTEHTFTSATTTSNAPVERFQLGLSFPPVVALNDLQSNSLSSTTSTTSTNDQHITEDGDARNIETLLQVAARDSDKMLRDMSEQEIDESRSELLSQLSPAVIQMLKTKNLKPRRGGKLAADAPVTVEQAEATKLAWTRDIDPVVDAAPTTVLRFGFDGKVMRQVDVDVSVGLHHHGDQGDACVCACVYDMHIHTAALPGYSIGELVHLSHSSVAAQRALALQVLRRIFESRHTADVTVSVLCCDVVRRTNHSCRVC
jgi:hypothetical protein